jgi:hypothetical protein
MNNKIHFVLALSWVLVGCESQIPQFEGSRVGGIKMSFSGCDSIPEERVCTGDKNYPKVTINLDTWTVTPECAIAGKGRTITVTLESASEIERGSVKLFAKKLEDYFWLAGENSPNKNKIKIKVPKTTKSGKEFAPVIYSYGISTPTKCLDPRFEVTN